MEAVARGRRPRELGKEGKSALRQREGARCGRKQGARGGGEAKRSEERAGGGGGRVVSSAARWKEGGTRRLGLERVEANVSGLCFFLEQSGLCFLPISRRPKQPRAHELHGLCWARVLSVTNDSHAARPTPAAEVEGRSCRGRTRCCWVPAEWRIRRQERVGR